MRGHGDALCAQPGGKSSLPRLGRGWHELGARRWHGAGDRVLNPNSIMFQSRCRLRDQVRLWPSRRWSWRSPDPVQPCERSRWAVMVWKLDPEPRSCSFFVISKVRCARSRALRAASTRARGLLQRILRVANLDANLFFQLLMRSSACRYSSSERYWSALATRLRNGNVQTQPDVVVGRGIVEGILPGLPQNRWARRRIGLPETLDRIQRPAKPDPP